MTSATLVRRLRSASRRPANLGEVPPGAVSLAIGEPGEDTPRRIVDAAVDALHRGRTRYAPALGVAGLRESIADSLADDGTPVGSESVVLTHGGSAGLAATMLALLEPGDVVVVPEPTYSLYADHIAMAGAECRWVPMGADGRLDIAAINLAAQDATLLVLCNPGNPTGLVLTAAEVAGIGSILAQRGDLTLVCDEAYGDIVFDDRPFVSALALTSVRERVVVVRTFSKTFAMTGWRLGFVVAPHEVAADIALVHRTFAGPLNTVVQDAALVALAPDPAELARVVAGYERRRDVVIDALGRLDVVELVRPEGAFYALPRLSVGLSSDELTARFAAGGVLVRSGLEYGPSGEGSVRISFATDTATLAEGLDRFVRVVTKLAAR